MKKLHLIIGWFVLSLSGLIAQEEQVQVKKIWESPDNLYTCESVLFNVKAHEIYVSCINGNPTDKDGNGFISVLSENGDLKYHHWIAGLNAPKGMGIYNGFLYVTDIDEVLKINIATTKIAKRFPVQGAKFLNDITIDEQGDVYISDMATGIIHRIHKDAIGIWLKDKAITGPNGLNLENGELLIGTRSGIMSVRLEDKRLWELVSDTGGIDGLEPDWQGNYMISDWAGKIQRVSPNDDAILILDFTKEGVNAADINYIPERNLLLVPTFSSNRVDAYEIIFTK